jgi:2-oxoglutarate dehydrogenase E2 component (dihydrolipoamide succinyltransferase)
MMTKFAPAKNSKLVVTSASLSAMFAIVGGLGYNQQVANAVSLNAQTLQLVTPIEIPAQVASTTQVAQAEALTTKTTKKIAKPVAVIPNVPAANVVTEQAAPSNPAPAAAPAQPAPAPVVEVAPVVVAPAPAAPAQAATGGS